MRDTISINLKDELTFALKLTNDELREFRSKAESQLTTFGDGTRMSLRASDVISIVQELINLRKVVEYHDIRDDE